MPVQPEDTFIRLPFNFENFDSYDLGECSSLLKRLESLETEQVRSKDYKLSVRNIDSQVNYTMFF